MAPLDQCIFRKKSGRLTSAVPKILAIGSYFSENFLPSLDCFNSQLKYENSENLKADYVNTFVFNLHQIKRRTIFFGHPVQQ